MKFFTPEEANRELAVVRPLVERLVALRRAFLDLEGELETLREKVAGNGGGLSARRLGELEAASAKAAAGVSALVGELDELGVQVKDLATGLVDFPARHPADGSTILLCWRLGEGDVRYWHELEAGFAGRKPLPF